MTNQNPAFVAYAVASCVLILNQIVLWMMSAMVRGKTKVTPNPEDLPNFKDAGKLGDDPPAVARVLRAHRNAADNILPFAILGLLFVVWGGSPLLTGIFCGVFVAARLAHSVSYLAEKQPWRTLSFVVGGVDMETHRLEGEHDLFVEERQVGLLVEDRHDDRDLYRGRHRVGSGQGIRHRPILRAAGAEKTWAAGDCDFPAGAPCRASHSRYDRPGRTPRRAPWSGA